jgi:hypothetical protein
MTAQRGWTVPKVRRMFYTSAKLLGDYQAAKTGRVTRRVANRVIGRATGRAIGRITRDL